MYDPETAILDLLQDLLATAARNLHYAQQTAPTDRIDGPRRLAHAEGEHRMALAALCHAAALAGYNDDAIAARLRAADTTVVGLTTYPAS